jgi:hypothetical protein
MDVWNTSAGERLEVPRIYFSHQRRCVRRHGQWLPVNDLVPPKPGEEVQDLVVRVRTIGDIISTGCVVSPADNVDDIIAEIAVAGAPSAVPRGRHRLRGGNGRPEKGRLFLDRIGMTVRYTTTSISSALTPAVLWTMESPP